MVQVLEGVWLGWSMSGYRWAHLTFVANDARSQDFDPTCPHGRQHAAFAIALDAQKVRDAA